METQVKKLVCLAVFLSIATAPAVAQNEPSHPLSQIHPFDVPLNLSGQPILDSSGDVQVQDNLDLNGNELINVIADKRDGAPSTVEGKLWYDNVNNVLRFWNGTKWIDTSGGSGSGSTQDLKSVLATGNSAGGNNIDMNNNSVINASKIGVGTTSPAYRLHVDAESGRDKKIARMEANSVSYTLDTVAQNRLISELKSGGEHVFSYLDSAHSNTYLPKLFFQRTDTTYGVIGLERASNGFVESQMILGTTTNQEKPVSILTNGTQRLFINGTNGHTGIGTTNPHSLLEIAGTDGVCDPCSTLQVTETANHGGILINNTQNQQAHLRFANGTGLRWQIRTPFHETGGNQLRIFNFDTNQDVMTLDDSGNVGVGTSSPANTLHIKDSTINTRVQLEAGTDGDADLRLFGDRDWLLQNDGGGSIGPADAFHIWDNTASTSRLMINTNGNIGIGTTSPSAPLQVAGSAILDRLVVEYTGASNIPRIRSTQTDRPVEIGDGSIQIGTGVISREASENAPFDIKNLATASGKPIRFYTGDGTGNPALQRLYLGSSKTSGGADAPIYFTNIDNIGIGTTSPSWRLEVDRGGGASGDGKLAQFHQTGSETAEVEVRADTTEATLKIVSDTHVNTRYITGGTTRYRTGYDGSNTQFELWSTDVDGGGTNGDIIRIPDGQDSVDFRGSVDSNAFDYAEWMEKADYSETFERGDLVGIVNRKVTHNTRVTDMVMVVSSDPSFVGGNAGFDMLGDEAEEYYDERVQIAFTGQVPVKIWEGASNGDYVLPSGNHDGTGIAVDKNEATFQQYKDAAGIVLSEFSIPDNADAQAREIYKEMMDKADNSNYKLYWMAVGTK